MLLQASVKLRGIGSGLSNVVAAAANGHTFKHSPPAPSGVRESSSSAGNAATVVHQVSDVNVLLKEFRAVLAKARMGGGTKSVERHHARGKL
jgi:hypothetical protein